MSAIKKITLYDVNPRYFKDVSGDGIGDLKGLSQKFDYFKFLDVDGIILQDILSTDSNDQNQSFTKVASDLGELNDLVRIISQARIQKQKLFIEINIGSISEENRWFDILLDKHTDGSFGGIVKFYNRRPDVIANTTEVVNASITTGYYARDAKTKEIPINWQSENTLKRFTDVIRFWHELGIDGFVLKNFEYAADENHLVTAAPMSARTRKELRKFYRAIKEIDNELVVVGRSDILDAHGPDDFTKGASHLFDLFLPTSISMLGTFKNSIDYVGKFKTKSLAKELNAISKRSGNILTFGSNRVGRVVSRWGTEGQFHNEAAKTIMLAQLLNKVSTSIYYGDEIGVKNIGLSHHDDFQDEYIDSRKKNTINSRYSEHDFMSAQVFQHPINSRALFAWNNQKNGGFSNADQTITPVGPSYKHVNVADEFKDKHSVLNFSKELIALTRSDEIKSILDNGKFKASSVVPGLIKIKISNNKREIIAFLNFTNANRPIFWTPPAGKIVISTYDHKKYPEDEFPRYLEAFESIVIARLTDQYTKELRLKRQLSLVKRHKTNAKVKELKSFEENAIKKMSEAKARDHAMRKAAKANARLISIEEQEEQLIVKAKLEAEKLSSRIDKTFEIKLSKLKRQQIELDNLKTQELKVKAKEAAKVEAQKLEQTKTKTREIAQEKHAKEEVLNAKISERQKIKNEKSEKKKAKLIAKINSKKDAEKEKLNEHKENLREIKNQKNVYEQSIVEAKEQVTREIKAAEERELENAKSALSSEEIARVKIKEKSEKNKEKSRIAREKIIAQVDAKALKKAEKAQRKEEKAIAKQQKNLFKSERLASALGSRSERKVLEEVARGEKEAIRAKAIEEKRVKSIKEITKQMKIKDRQKERSQREIQYDKMQQEQEQLKKMAEREGDYSALVDEQVAKTIQVEIDETTDMEEFLKVLDKKDKKNK